MIDDRSEVVGRCGFITAESTAHGGCREDPESEKECESSSHDRINGPVPIPEKDIGKTSNPLQRCFIATLA
jgi:hypothetical protein